MIFRKIYKNLKNTFSIIENSGKIYGEVPRRLTPRIFKILCLLNLNYSSKKKEVCSSPFSLSNVGKCETKAGAVDSLLSFWICSISSPPFHQASHQADLPTRWSMALWLQSGFSNPRNGSSSPLPYDLLLRLLLVSVFAEVFFNILIELNDLNVL